VPELRDERARPPAAPRVAGSRAAKHQITQSLHGARVADVLDPTPGPVARVELAAECAECGVIVELAQGSAFCFGCTYQGWPA
jgi:hypothetical protein